MKLMEPATIAPPDIPMKTSPVFKMLNAIKGNTSFWDNVLTFNLNAPNLIKKQVFVLNVSLDTDWEVLDYAALQPP